jgi:hypothetical protein
MEDAMHALPPETPEAVMRAAIPDRAVWEHGRLCAHLKYHDDGIVITRFDKDEPTPPATDPETDRLA